MKKNNSNNSILVGRVLGTLLYTLCSSNWKSVV